VIASLQLAELGRRRGLRLLGTKLRPADVRGLRYAELMVTAPLSERTLPRPNPARLGLFAAWDDDRAFEDFLAADPLAQQFARGWRVRLQPTRIFGAWPELPGLPADEQRMDEAEPAGVLTLGRLRLSQAIRFLRASAGAEGLALSDPALLAATGLARPPALVATFSLWRTTSAMRAYAHGGPGPGHLAAIREHAARPFHHRSAFIRFRPYAAEGSWSGCEPLAAKRPGSLEPASA
jgi:hypothetical protein